MELTKTDKILIGNIATEHEADPALVEKLYTEMLQKAKAQAKFKEMFAKLREKQLNIKK
jgi:hypothetical protein